MSKWDTDYVNPLLGKKIVKVFLADDGNAIRFDVEGQEKPIIARTEGDCCSRTWIESLDAIPHLFGTVQSVEDLAMPPTSIGSENEDGDECIQYYGCRITTERGACVIDYRNSSNGYYGGSLEWDEPIYGGAYKQNKSKEIWRELT